MSAEIAQHLAVVEAERRRRAAEPGLLEKVTAVKTFQQRRFAHTYADLLQSARHGDAARFFLAELYGPTDFTRRDAQFGRVAPMVARVFPDEIAETVTILAGLHALSEVLDSAMASAITDAHIAPIDYVVAWRRVGRASDRERQISLTLRIATQLDRITRLPLVRNALRMMRTPARIAGFGELQRMLESGFDTFQAMHGADEFIATIDARERALAADLFAPEDDEAARARALAALPG